MDYRRIIPCLDVKGGRLVKGINFVKLKDVGDPAENAAVYSQAGADELVFLDITATIENRKTLLDAVKSTIERITVPLTVGGGIRNCRSIEELINLGASKVSINTAAVHSQNLIKEAAKEFGSEKITVAIDTCKNAQLPSGFEVMINGGTKGTGKDAVEWAKRVEDLGAGAILPTSMDADGTTDGYDIEFTKAISDAVSVPVVASGVAGELDHFYEAVVEGGASVLLAASVFHFRVIRIPELKEFLQEKGIEVKL